MAAKRVVLVTGVSRDLGARFARSLAAEAHLEVIGIDVIPPRHDLGTADFVRADIRNPVISKVIGVRGVDTVVHLAMVATPDTAGSRSSMKEINVIGTMQLLAACQKAETFQKLVVQSSISVYGASPRDPAKFTEDMSARAQPRTGFGKDSLEIEGYVRGLARRRPDVVLATDHAVPGTFNVAAADIVTLSQALRKMGRPSVGVPHSAAPLVATLVRQARLVDFTADQIDALTYGRVMDTSRFAAETGFVPQFSSLAALEEFVNAARPGLLSPERVDSALAAVSRVLGATAVRGG
jgi:UDP-glucose 4-epimerase